MENETAIDNYAKLKSRLIRVEVIMYLLIIAGAILIVNAIVR